MFHNNKNASDSDDATRENLNAMEADANMANFKVIDISKKKKKVPKTKVHYVLDCERRLTQFKKEFKELFEEKLEKNTGSFEDHYSHVV
jgi:hypothetical protein